MPLSSEQHQQLLQQTKANVPNWKISWWLMNECLLSFREASDLRHQAIEEIKKLEYEETQRQREADTLRQEKGLEAPQKKENSIPEKTSGEELEIPIIEEEGSTEACASCGCEDQSCDCAVKKVEDIPF